jgi:hypothetical protein
MRDPDLGAQMSSVSTATGEEWSGTDGTWGGTAVDEGEGEEALRIRPGIG